MQTIPHPTSGRAHAARAIACGCVAAVVATASTAVAHGAASTVPQFHTCLAGRGVKTTLGPGLQPGTSKLTLPSRLPAPATIDRAFAACRKFVRWPRGYGNAKLVYFFRKRGLSFRACMRDVGRDPGPPRVILADIGIGVIFDRAFGTPPTRCARLLPNR